MSLAKSGLLDISGLNDDKLNQCSWLSKQSLCFAITACKAEDKSVKFSRKEQPLQTRQLDNKCKGIVFSFCRNLAKQLYFSYE